MLTGNSGIQDIGWRFYIIFAVTNLCFIPIIWLFYPETAGLSLDEIDWMFSIKYGSSTKITYKEAALRVSASVSLSSRVRTTKLMLSVSRPKSTWRQRGCRSG